LLAADTSRRGAGSAGTRGGAGTRVGLRVWLALRCDRRCCALCIADWCFIVAIGTSVRGRGYCLPGGADAIE